MQLPVVRQHKNAARCRMHRTARCRLCARLLGDPSSLRNAAVLDEKDALTRNKVAHGTISLQNIINKYYDQKEIIRGTHGFRVCGNFKIFIGVDS